MVINNNLICHAGTPCAAVQNFDVELERLGDGDLILRYQLTGDPAQLRIPTPLPPEMTDGLWRHTCFEAFVAVAGNDEYHEFNFSPSGQWAAYAFNAYRRRREWTASRSPGIDFVQKDGRLLLEAVIAAADLPQNPHGMPFHLGLTAVIESTGGLCSYWALHHPSADPDFHHQGGFILSLQPACSVR